VKRLLLTSHFSWAAKEAVIKAFSMSRRLHYKDVEILKQQSGTPFAVVLDARKAGHEQSSAPSAEDESALRESEHADDYDGQVVRISISHDGDYCVATAIAALEPAAGDVGAEAAARDPLQ